MAHSVVAKFLRLPIIRAMPMMSDGSSRQSLGGDAIALAV